MSLPGKYRTIPIIMHPPEDTLKSTRGQDGKVKPLVTAVVRPCFRFSALSRGSSALKIPAKAENITKLVKCLPCRPQDPSSISEGNPSARETEIGLAQG